MANHNAPDAGRDLRARRERSPPPPPTSPPGGIPAKADPGGVRVPQPAGGRRRRQLRAELATVAVATPRIPGVGQHAPPPRTRRRARRDPRAARRRRSHGPVRFVDQIEAMYAAGARVFVEAGPGRVLTQPRRQDPRDRPHGAIATDVPGEHGVRAPAARARRAGRRRCPGADRRPLQGTEQQHRSRRTPGPRAWLVRSMVISYGSVRRGRRGIAATRRRVPDAGAARVTQGPNREATVLDTCAACARWSPPSAR